MSLVLQRNGENLINFNQASITKSIENVCGEFSFTSTADVNNLFPVKVGDSIKALADGQQVLSGFVESLNAEHDFQNHQITVAGRGLLCDLVDSTLSEQKEFQKNVSLVDIAKIVLADIGIKVDVIDNTGGKISFGENEVESPEIGQKAFDFLESYARKKQVLVTSDGKGNLVLTRAKDKLFPAILKNKINGNDNNILSGELSIDTTEVYGQYICVSQLNTLFSSSKTSPKVISKQISSPAVNSNIRKTRKLTFNAEESSDELTVTLRAKWEANIRRARSLNYIATVQGHSANVKLWEANNLVFVQDEFAGINGKMFIKSVTYTESLDEGSKTHITMTYKDAYTLQAEQDQKDANTDKQGGGFFARLFGL